MANKTKQLSLDQISEQVNGLEFTDKVTLLNDLKKDVEAEAAVMADKLQKANSVLQSVNGNGK